LPRRIGAQIADSLIKGEKHPLFGSRAAEDDRIRRSRDPFFPNRVRVVTRFAKIVQQLGRDVLVKL